MSIYNTRRFYHTYVLGKSGYGKSTALERWAIDDILNGERVIFFDVHGESVDTSARRCFRCAMACLLHRRAQTRPSHRHPGDVGSHPIQRDRRLDGAAEGTGLEHEGTNRNVAKRIGKGAEGRKQK